MAKDESVLKPATTGRKPESDVESGKTDIKELLRERTTDTKEPVIEKSHAQTEKGLLEKGISPSFDPMVAVTPKMSVNQGIDVSDIRLTTFFLTY